MSDKAAATAWIRDLAEHRLDRVLAEHGGFTRGGGPVTYVRKVPDGRQRIHFDLMVRPGSYHLGLRASIAFPRMAALGAELFGAQASGFGKSGNVHVVALDHIERNPPMLLFTSAAELDALAPAVERHLIDSIVPYLDGRDSIAKLTEATLNQLTGADPGGPSRLPVIAAAGQLALGEADRAVATLEAAYPEGTQGRKLYAEAFPVARAALT